MRKDILAKAISQHIFIVLVFVCFMTNVTFAQTGGNFTITQSVVAGGGNSAAVSGFALEATSGQAAAGNALNGTPFDLTSGFWNALVAPTAATVSVGGRVLSFEGRFIPSVRVLLTNQNGETRTAISNQFGYYCFDEVTVGETYVLTVTHKRHQFAPQILTVIEEINDLNFTANP
jgi:hypothetical protein